MATTIQVSEKTRQMLEMAKNRMGAKSLDETIEKAISDHLNAPKSMFGKLKGKMKPFARKERLEMWRY